MAAVFSMQGAGQLAAVLVALVVTFGFRDSFSIPSFAACGLQCQVAADRGWRIIIGISALPAVFALYYRLTIPETPRYTFDVAQDIEKANADIRAFKDGQHEGHPNALQRAQTKLTSAIFPRASWADFFSYFGTWKNGSLLFATTVSWFLVDLVFYGLGLNYPIMLAAIGYGSTKDTVYHDLFDNGNRDSHHRMCRFPTRVLALHDHHRHDRPTPLANLRICNPYAPFLHHRLRIQFTQPRCSSSPLHPRAALLQLRP